MTTKAPTPTRQLRVDRLRVAVYPTDESMGLAAAIDAEEILNAAIAERGAANLILATGNSQLTFLRELQRRSVDWSAVTVFHLDEYVGIDPEHRASFPRFLRQHFLDAVDVAAFHPIASDAHDVERVCREYEALLRAHPADLVALGWGENGHLAFNDPPDARFDDPNWVKAVTLAHASRAQQLGEGHFDTLDEVPTRAITLTIPALLAAAHVLCIVPERRKAEAVRACLTEDVSEDRPGSVLRRVDHARLYLDEEAASLL
jgi:glucosamine-6-phosphate deaminase